MKKRKYGFTILEIILALVMLSILFSMAIPNYQKQLVKAKVLEIEMLANNLKLEIIEYYYYFDKLPETLEELGIDYLSDNTKNKKYKYIKNIKLENNMLILQANTQALGIPSSKLKLIYEINISNNGVNFTCHAIGDKKYSPYSCR